MILRPPSLAVLLAAVLVAPGATAVETFEVTATGEKSTLERGAGRVASSVRVTIRNSGDRIARPPFHAAIEFTGAASLAGLTVAGAQGGPGLAPYGTFFIDLSGQVGEGLAPGQESTFTLEFSRPTALRVNYRVVPHATLNRDPTVRAGGPYTGKVGQAIAFDGGTSTDPDGHPLTFTWKFGDGATATGAQTSHTFDRAGIFQVELEARDSEGATTRQKFSVPVGPAAPFALARTRTLDGAGLPLPGVTIVEQAVGGSPVEFQSEGSSGFASLGSGAAEHVWRFVKDGHLPVWRRHTLVQDQVVLLPDPWLPSANTETQSISPITDSTLRSPHGVEVAYAAGAFAQPATAAITDLGPQTLPFPLPPGWRPVLGIHVGWSEPAGSAGAAVALPWEAIPPSMPLTLARFDEQSVGWIAQSASVTRASGSIAFPVLGAGFHVVVAPDTGDTAPPSPVAGEPLAGTVRAHIDPATAQASGTVTPAISPASTQADDVTAEARVEIVNEGLLPSSAWFRTEVDEAYVLRDGRNVRAPIYDTTIFTFRLLSENRANRGVARFPLRPQLLLGSEDLESATVHSEIVAPGEFPGSVLDASGGVVSSGPVTLAAAPGALLKASAAEIRVLASEKLAGAFPGVTVVAAFEFNVAHLAAGAAFSTAFDGLEPSAHYVLGRLVVGGGDFGIEPLERIATDAGAVGASAEPSTGDRLPGLHGSGQFVVVKSSVPLGLVRGTARIESGSPAGGLGVRVAGQPWISVSESDGGYAVLAPAGGSTISALNPANGNEGNAIANVADVGQTTLVDLTTGPTGPRVVSTDPAAEATGVRVVTPINVRFSEPINPATFAIDGLRLLDPAGNPVPGTLSLDRFNKLATFLPNNPLEPITDYTLVVAATITDPSGLALEGANEFGFTTAPVAERAIGAQLTIFEPDAVNIPAGLILPGYNPAENLSRVVAVGSAGTADPGVAVILVNETTGETATVPSNPDGSFANFIAASEEDFISATFVNANGTRISVPATEQKFDDGRVGLYRHGGILEAESDGGPSQVIVEPGAVPSRTVFKLDALTFQQLQELLGGTEPEGGKALSGLRYEEQGDPIEAAADVSFPLNVSDLPPGVTPETATFALTLPREANGVKGFQIIDSMEVVEDANGNPRLVTRSPPFVGLLLRQLNAMREQAGFQDTLNRASTAGLGSMALETGSAAGHLVAILAAPFISQKIAGKVVALADGEAFTGFNGLRLGGAFVRVETGLGAIDSTSPGLFRRGEQFAMTDSDGRYALPFPTAFNRRVVATHTRFPFERASSTGIPTGDVVAKADLIFRIPAATNLEVADTAPPEIGVSQNPRIASVGQNATDGTVLTVTVADDLQVTNVEVEVYSFTGLDGATKLPTAVQEPDPISDIPAGPARRSVEFVVQATDIGVATYRIVATDGSGNLGERFYTVIFGESGGGTSEDLTPRRLVYSWPPNGSENIAPGTPVLLRFSQSLTPEQLANPNLITLAPSDSYILMRLEPSADRREVTIHYYDLSQATADALQSAQPLQVSFAAGFLDQTPGGDSASAEPPDYSISFSRPAVPAVNGAQLTAGAGVVLAGRHAFALDRTENEGGRVIQYTMEDDGSFTLEEETPITDGRLMDLVFIPNYPLRKKDGAVVPARHYLAVFAGQFDGLKRMNLFEVGEGGSLTPVFGETRPVVSIGTSQIIKAKWDPPFIGLHELTPGSSNVRLINLNALHIGFELSTTDPDALESLPLNGEAGIDLNNDGDFADAGEKAPLPGKRDGQVFGLEFSWAPLDPAEVVKDFDFESDFGLLAAAFRSPAGNGLMMVLGGGQQLNESLARVTFPQEPKRVILLPRLRLLVAGVEKLADVALVSTVADSAGEAPLLVIDVTTPTTPVLLGSARLPPAVGSLNTIVRRDDGLLSVSTSNHGIFVLDPRLLLVSGPDGLTAALQRRIPGLVGGGQPTYVTDASGIGLTANGGTVRAALAEPSIRVVTIDRVPFDTVSLLDGFVGEGGTTDEKILDTLGRSQPVSNGAVLDPTEGSAPFDQQRHFYVIVRAPGVSGPEIALAAAAVDGRGLPVLPSRRNLTPGFLGEAEITPRLVALAALNFIKGFSCSELNLQGLAENTAEAIFMHFYEQAGLALGDEPIFPTRLIAIRLSADESCPLFNTYLAGPLVLLAKTPERPPIDDLQAGVVRTYLNASEGFWVGFSPTLSDHPLLGRHVSRQLEEVEFTFNAGANLQTFTNAATLLASLLSGNVPCAVLSIVKFIDGDLERSLLPGLNAYVSVGVRRNPVVFVPGIMGSQLESPTGSGTDCDADRLWINVGNAIGSLIPIVGLDSAVNRLVLDANLDGEAVRPFDILRGIGPLDLGGSIIEHLVSDQDYHQYTFDCFTQALSPSAEMLEGRPNLFVFPYDWRLPNSQAAQKLKEYVDLIQSIHPEADKIDLVAHSMGGLVSRRFILDNPGKVGRLISVASPFLGASKAVFSKRSGDLDEVALNLLVGDTVGKKVSRYMAGLDQLMPSRALFDLGFRPLHENGIDLNGDGYPFSALKYDEYKKVLDQSLYRLGPPPAPTPIATHNEPFHSHQGSGGSQDNWRNDSSGVRYFHLVAFQRQPKTITRVKVTPRFRPVDADEAADVALGAPPVEFIDSDQIGQDTTLVPTGPADFPVSEEAFRLELSLDLERGPGDSTVPLLSAARGYGAGVGDFNAPDAVVIPVVSAAVNGGDDVDEAKEDKIVGHVDVLVNPITKAWVSRILSDEFRPEDVPRVQVNLTGSLAEGGTVTANATAQAPEGTTGTPAFLWDTGDGRTLTGPSVPIGYAENGSYTLTCTARYPDGKAGLISTTVQVGNSNPVPAVRVLTENPIAGQQVRFVVEANDPGGQDALRYEWSFGDGTPATPPDDAFALSHIFVEPGNFTVAVTVTDDDGGSGIANAQVSIGPAAPAAPSFASLRAPLPSPSPTPDDDDNPFDDDPGAGFEYASVVCTGVNTAEDLVRVEHDGKRVIGITDGSIVRNDGGEADATGQNEVTIDIYRDIVSGAVPQRSDVIVRATGENVALFVHYFRGNGQARCFRFMVPTDTGDDVTLALRWESLLTIAENQIPTMVVPAPLVAESVPDCRRDSAILDVATNDVDEMTVETTTLTEIDGDPTEEDEPITLISEDPVTDPGGSSPGGPENDPVDPCLDLEGAIFRRVTGSVFHPGTAPTGHAIIATLGPTGQAIVSSPQPPQVNETIDPALFVEVRDTLRVVLNTASTEALFKNFVLEMSDVLLFEQGTGACMWKNEAKCAGAYNPKKSDNDYEIFFPLHKRLAAALDPNSASQREEFLLLAHDAGFMEGDWYFKLPRGFAGAVDLGPPPDFADTAAYNEYIQNVTRWVWTKPAALPGPLSGNSVVEVARGARFFGQSAADSIFNHPMSPAAVIAFVLTETARIDVDVRRVLKDVSFFPFRREHFEYAIMSLERPPPFGDDPLGDAGMGRSLLLLKWVLEGAFLPAIGNFNAGITPSVDEQRRTAVFNRLRTRATSPSDPALKPDGFEWGLYQEFAALSESAQLRIRPASGTAITTIEECRAVFGNYLDAHDDKIMKKAGKAAMRGMLARMAAGGGALNTFLLTTPAAFDGDVDLRSFEHLVARVANQNLSQLFSALDTDDVRRFLGAKVGHQGTFDEVRLLPDGVDGFLKKAFDLLVNVQFETQDEFTDYVDDLIAAGRVAERHVRRSNAHDIDYGFQPVAGPRRDGRAQMHGIQDLHKAHYDFVINIQNRSDDAVGPLRLTLTTSAPTPLTICPALTVSAGETTLVIPGRDSATACPIERIRYERPVGSTAIEDLFFRLEGIPSAINLNPQNDRIELKSEFLTLPRFFDSSLQPVSQTRILYRGLNLTGLQFQTFLTTELQAGRLLSASRRAGVDDDVARDDMANALDQRVAQNGGFFAFTAADVALFGNNDLGLERRAALFHTGSTPTDSLGISTAEHIDRALAAAATGLNRQILLILEVPSSSAGFEYLPTTLGMRRINPAEGNEVVFLGELRFTRVHVFEVIGVPGVFGMGDVIHLGSFNGTP